MTPPMFGRQPPKNQWSRHFCGQPAVRPAAWHSTESLTVTAVNWNSRSNAGSFSGRRAHDVEARSPHVAARFLYTACVHVGGGSSLQPASTTTSRSVAAAAICPAEQTTSHFLDVKSQELVDVGSGRRRQGRRPCRWCFSSCSRSDSRHHVVRRHGDPNAARCPRLTPKRLIDPRPPKRMGTGTSRA